MALAIHEPVRYPSKRGGLLPQPPLSNIAETFRKILNSPRRQRYYQLFKAAAQQGRSYIYKQDINYGEFTINSGKEIKTYYQTRQRFANLALTALLEEDFSLETWEKIAKNAPDKFGADSNKIMTLSKADPFEQQLISQFWMFINHETTHNNPSGIINHFLKGTNYFEKYEGCSKKAITEQTQIYLKLFVRDLPILFPFFENIEDIGIAFFGPDQELKSLAQIRGNQLKYYIQMFANIYAMRFLPSHFQMLPQGSKIIPLRNTVIYNVDPNLSDVSLPLSILGNKLGCNIKNAIRVATDEEILADSSFKKAINGQNVKNPIRFRIDCKRISAKVWEMRFSDNGRGIVLKDTLVTLAEAVDRIPEAVNPALRHAVQEWKHGNAFAFNNVPLEDILQAVFHLGISVGRGAKGSGMGLWGTTALLTRLGAQIKVGITPQTGGFYESVLLPVDLSVSPEEVSRVAKHFYG